MHICMSMRLGLFLRIKYLILTTSLHYAWIYYTLDGSSVLYVIIIAGVEQKYQVETGLDVDTKIVCDAADSDIFAKNRGKGCKMHSRLEHIMVYLISPQVK